MNAIALSGGNQFFVGGEFSKVGGFEANNIAFWNGTRWHPLGSGTAKGQTSTHPTVRSLAAAGRTVYVGEDFTIAGGLEANHIAVWRGCGWDQMGSGADDSVLGIALDGSAV